MRAKSSRRSPSDIWSQPANPEGSSLGRLKLKPPRKLSKKTQELRKKAVEEEIKRLCAPYRTVVTAATLDKILD